MTKKEEVLKFFSSTRVLHIYLRKKPRALPGVSRTKLFSGDFPGPGKFWKKSRTFKDVPGHVQTLQ